jgi:Ca2+-binding RTX toxin-like protein
LGAEKGGAMRRVEVAFLGVGFVVMGLITGATAAETPSCFRQTATIVGTSGPDNLVGGNGSDVIVGLGGNDFIAGRGGNDRICGGAGNDSSDFPSGDVRPGLDAGPGNDKVQGGPGIDDVNGGPVLEGSAGIDGLHGGPGADVLCDNFCIAGEDFGESATGPDDTLFGGRGGDRLVATGGDDRSEGNPGDDTISVTDGVSGNDVANGGPHVLGDRCFADIDDLVVRCNP